MSGVSPRPVPLLTSSCLLWISAGFPGVPRACGEGCGGVGEGSAMWRFRWPWDGREEETDEVDADARAVDRGGAPPHGAGGAERTPEASTQAPSPGGRLGGGRR